MNHLPLDWKGRIDNHVEGHNDGIFGECRRAGGDGLELYQW